MPAEAYVYFMANERNNVLYIGVTSNLIRRVAEHKLGRTTFTKRYRCSKLVYFEAGTDIATALVREKQLKKWRRPWKDGLVAECNPDWQDLAPSIGVTTEVLAYVHRLGYPTAGDPGASPG